MSLAKLLKTGNEDKARELLLQPDFDPNAVDPKTRQTALHLLVKEAQSELLRDLLDKPSPEEGLQPNLEARDAEDKVASPQQTPLASALLLGNEDAAVHLLNAGADPNTLFDRQNMLMLCASVKKPRLTNALLLRGADPNFTNKAGSALHHALEAENDQMFASLLGHPGVPPAHQLDLLAANAERETVLHLAVSKYHIWAIPTLIEHIKEHKLAGLLAAKDKQGNTAVHIAAKNMRSNVVSLLQKACLELGVAPDLKNDQGFTPDELVREVESQKRAELKKIEEDKQQEKMKKAQLRAQKQAEEQKLHKEADSQKDLARLKKKREELERQEQQKRAPLMLLFYLAIAVVVLYLVLRIGVATGATNPANQKDINLSDLHSHLDD